VNNGSKISSCAYITVGTGIGVGLVIGGECVHGLMHPEGGHLSMPRLASEPSFKGQSDPKACPFGGLTPEGMAGSKAISLRAGLSSTAGLAGLPDDHAAWDATAYYLGALCANLLLLASPERIVLSGGVMQRACLFPLVRKHVQAHLNGYIRVPQVVTQAGIDELIVPSVWGNKAGLIGALTLAELAQTSRAGGLRSAWSKPTTTTTVVVAAALAGVLGFTLAKALAK